MFSSSVKKFISDNKYPGFQPKAVFFDMDGVLYDSMQSHATAWTNAMNELGIPFTITEAYMNEGRTGHSTIDGAFVKNFGRTATEEEKQAIYQRKTIHFESYGKTETMPWAHELLNKVKSDGMQISLVTGSAQLSLIDNLQKNFPDIFTKERMVTAFDVTHGKPHPEPYLKALEKSGLKPWEVMVVENAPLGVEAAVSAGLFTIAVNTGPLDSSVLSESGAHLVFDGGMKELHERWEVVSALQK